jgi:hypothetical protein
MGVWRSENPGVNPPDTTSSEVKVTGRGPARNIQVISSVHQAFWLRRSASRVLYAHGMTCSCCREGGAAGQTGDHPGRLIR